MALRWFDGFEQYGTIARLTEGVGGGAAWSDVSVSGIALSTTAPATQSYHMRISDTANNSRQMRRIWGTSNQVVGLGYRFQVEELPSLEGIDDGAALVLADIRDVSNQHQVMIYMGTDGSVAVQRGAGFSNNNSLGGTVLGRSEPCIAAGGYHHFECKVKIDNTTGYIEVRINEVTVLNLTGIDTQTTSNAHAAQFVLGKAGGSLSSGAGFVTFDVDDVFAWDDDASDLENTVVDWVGDKGVYLLKPNADTATADFTKNGSATSYGAIDEVPPNGTDYLDDSTGTARTIVEVEALPGNIAEVIAMQGFLYTRKEDSGSVSMRAGIVVGTDESYGPTDSPSTAYAYLRPAVKTIDPDTGVAWSNSADPKLLIERTA